jgi:hypothetical protein
MKTVIINTILFILLLISNRVLSQNDYFSPARLSFDIGMSYGGGKEESRNISLDLSTNYIAKKWGNNFYQVGLGLNFNSLTIENIPVNNSNIDINLPSRFVKLQNRFFVSLNRNNDLFAFGDLTYGMNLKNKAIPDGFNQQGGSLFEQGIGLQFFINKYQYIKVAFYHSLINVRGDLRSSDSNTPSINLNTSSHLFNIRVSADILSFTQALLHLF